MQNLELARLFREIADLLELKGENPFKIRAYRRAAEAIEALPEEIGRAVESGALRRTPGIGEATAAKAKEWLATGRIGFHDALRQKIPPGLLEVMRLPTVGPKRAWRLYEALGIRDVAELAAACRAQRVRALRGFGERSEAAILAAIERRAEQGSLWPLGVALPLAEGLAASLGAAAGVDTIAVAGSARRMKETVRDLDLVAAAPPAEQERLMAAFVELPVVSAVLAKGSTKSRVRLHNGLETDLRVVSPDAFGSALHHFTGSREHNVRLRELARRRGWSISEYGILDEASGVRTAFDSEAALFEWLALPLIPPELREDGREIECAQRGELPRLVSADAVRGDLHVHTLWSDGSESIEAMARAAAARGYEYLAICDHSPYLGITRGLDRERLEAQAREIDAVNEKGLGVHVLRGVEVDILPDGRLDLPDEVLAACDVVVASIHSGLAQDRARLRERLRRACENPHVDIIGHPTGRLLNRRDPADVDIEMLVETAVRTGTALEINASPQRLDLKDAHTRYAAEAGAVLVINTDAHAQGELDALRYGIGVARRAWVEPGAILNTRPLPSLLEWLRERR